MILVIVPKHCREVPYLDAGIVADIQNGKAAAFKFVSARYWMIKTSAHGLVWQPLDKSREAVDVSDWELGRHTEARKDLR